MSQNTESTATEKIKKVTEAFLMFSIFVTMGFSVAVEASRKSSAVRMPASTGDTELASEVSFDRDNVQIVVNNGELSSAFGKCSFAGDTAAIASNIDVHIERGEFKKLELSAFSGNCKISLDEFTRDESNSNMVFRNTAGCTVVVSLLKRTKNAEGFRMLSPDNVTNESAMLSAQTVPGTCNQFCPQLKNARKVWQIMMNPRTEQCE